MFSSRKVVCDIVVHSLAIDIGYCKYYHIGLRNLLCSIGIFFFLRRLLFKIDTLFLILKHLSLYFL